MTNFNLTSLIDRLAAVQWKAAATALLQHDPSTWIERSIRTLAIAIAFTYTAGWSIGHGVHRANTWCAERASAAARLEVWNQARQQRQPQTMASVTSMQEVHNVIIDVNDSVADEPSISSVTTLIKLSAAAKVPALTPDHSRQRSARNARKTTPMGFA